MKLGTHMSDGESRKPIDIEVCKSKVKVTTSKNRTKIWYIFCFRTISQVQVTKYTHAERNKSQELEVCGSKVKITIYKNNSNLILFNQNIVWGILTKFGTKIDSYKMDVYGTSGISDLAVILRIV